MDTQDVTETTTQLVVGTQLGVDINFSSVELTLSLDDFAERILEPAMTRLSAEVCKTIINGVYPYVWNFENTTFGTKPVLTDVLAARALLQQGLAPSGDRHCMVDALAANSIITDSKALFHNASEIERQYREGMLGTIAGLSFFESELTPVQTNGSRTDTTPTTSTASITNGTATITLSACNSSGTWTAGDVFTIAGVYAVNPETKVVQPYLQQWGVTSAGTAATSAVTLAVSPTPYKTTAKQNISVVTSSATAVTLHVSAGGSGTASTAFRNGLAYHRDAFTFVTADLEMPKGVDFAARKVIDNVSLRIVRNYDIINDKFPCRIDVLFGYKALRPGWAARICS